MMKRCVNCGKIVREDAKFCPNCGHSELIQYNPDKTVSLSEKEEEKKKENPQDSREARTEYHKNADYNYGSNADFKDQVKTSGNVDMQKEDRQESANRKKWGIRIAAAIAGCLAGAGLAWAMFWPHDSGADESASSDYVAEQESDVDEETIAEYSVTEDAAYNTDVTTTDETDAADKELAQDGPSITHRVNYVYKYNDDETRLLLCVKYDTYYTTGSGYDALDSALRQWCADQASELLTYVDEVALNEVISFEDYILETYGEDYYCQISLEYEVFYADDNVVSLREFTYMDLGGAHGSYTYSGVTFDTETGNVLALDEILSDSESFRAQAETFILEELESAYADELDPGYESTVVAMWDSPLWYLSTEGIVFIFNPYELGPFSMGEVFVTLPYADFGNFLRDDYADLSVAGGETVVGTDGTENAATVEDETAEENTEFVNEYREEIALSRLDSADSQTTGLSRLMSLDSGTFSELELNTYETTWDNGSANCIAEFPEDHIRMYGYFDDEVWFTGVAFDIDGEICYFDWCYSSVSLWPIQMYWNEDLQQLQVTCIIYHGTGFSAPDLYIVQKDDTGVWVSYRYGYEEYSKALEDRLLCVADTNNEFITIVDTQTGEDIVSQVDAGDELSQIDVDQFYFGNVSNFNLGDTIVYVCRSISDYYGLNGLDVPNLEFELILREDENGDISFELGMVEAVYGESEY